jgi:competence protein ComEA
MGLFALGVVGEMHLRKNPELNLRATESQQGLKPEATPATLKTESPTHFVVHIGGAVNKPGVLRVPPDTRVIEAIEQAGGALPEADLDRLNLAAKMLDGEKLTVPLKTDPPAPEPEEPVISSQTPAPVSSAAPKPAPTKPKAPAGPISLNTATKAQLEALPGIGPVTAQKILDYRYQHGGFASIDELQAVKGIGPKKLEQVRPHVKL